MQNEKWKKFTGSSRFVDLLLVSVAVLWGLGFPVTQAAVNARMSAGLIVTLRFALAAIAMFVLFFKEIKTMKGEELRAAALAGALLSSGFILQTIGIKFTTPSNNAFLTSTSVIMVPFLAWILFKQRPAKKLWAVAFGCFVGTVLLTASFTGAVTFAVGDLLTLMCAVVFSLHTVYLGKLAAKISAPKLAFVQMAAASLVGLGYVLVAERDALLVADFARGLPPTIYLAVFSTAYAFLVQTFAQSRTSATRTTIILSTEGLLGSLFSVLLGYELLTTKMVVGGLVIFTSLVLMEVDFTKLLGKKQGVTEAEE